MSTTSATAVLQSRTPSPAPPPPIPLTPGPRATQLQILYTNALTHTLRTCSYANFAACFPTPALRAPDVLASVWRQVTAQVEERARREFEGILGEREVVGGLNQLDRLVAEARGRRERGDSVGEAPHTLPPERLYLAHLAPYLMETEKELEARLRGVRAENEELIGEIGRQRVQVERLVEGFEAVVRDLESANEVMGGVVEGGDLAREVEEVERELKAAGREAKL